MPRGRVPTTQEGLGAPAAQISLRWDEKTKRWLVQASKIGEPLSISYSYFEWAENTIEMSQVLVARICHAVRNEIEQNLF